MNINLHKRLLVMCSLLCFFYSGKAQNTRFNTSFSIELYNVVNLQKPLLQPIKTNNNEFCLNDSPFFISNFFKIKEQYLLSKNELEIGLGVGRRKFGYKLTESNKVNTNYIKARIVSYTGCIDILYNYCFYKKVKKKFNKCFFVFGLSANYFKYYSIDHRIASSGDASLSRLGTAINYPNIETGFYTSVNIGLKNKTNIKRIGFFEYGINITHSLQKIDLYKQAIVYQNKYYQFNNKYYLTTLGLFLNYQIVGNKKIE